jgi:pyrrolidone-carboxylate peptidase
MVILQFCELFADPSASATKDKSRPDLAGSPSDGLLQPDGDKAFYENLPFHGMQSAPNKVNTPSVITCIPLLAE